jgi:large subunit ribosomal protein L9
MQVILTTDVKNVGKKYEIVDVAPGYARNFLFARGYAEAVTKSTAKRVAELAKRREVEAKKERETLEKALAGVTDTVIIMKRPANEEGHLYAGVAQHDLAEALGKTIGAAIEAAHIELEKPIKELGEFAVVAKVGEKSATFKVVVEAE